MERDVLAARTHHAGNHVFDAGTSITHVFHGAFCSRVGRQVTLLLFSILCSIWATGCATNPATGKNQLSLYGEAQEVEIGRSSDPQIVQQYGLYDDPELAAYVDRVGQDLAAASERPNLPWTFRVLDDPVVNAFALPGGYIYVTRGILGHMKSEAELAAVLGHEIGHVTARHGVNRMSKAQLANIGLGVGAILAPEVARSVGGLAQQGMQLLFLKYSRDDERQADALGFRYVDVTGTNPQAFTDVFTMLAASSGGAEGARLPAYLATHPDPLARRDTARQHLATLPAETLDRPWHRDRFFDRLDGLTYGPNPQEGFFEGRDFVHPGLGLRIELPEGWTGHNQKSALIAVSPNQDAYFQLSLAGESSVDEAARKFYNQESVSVRSSWRDDDPDIPLQSTRLFSAGSGEIYGAAGFVSMGGGVLRALAYSKAQVWKNYENAVESTLRSFGTLKGAKYRNIKPMRIELVPLKKDMTLEEFQRRYPSTVDMKRLGLVNHAAPDTVLKAGTRAKRIRGFDAGPQMGVELTDR